MDNNNSDLSSKEELSFEDSSNSTQEFQIHTLEIHVSGFIVETLNESHGKNHTLEQSLQSSCNESIVDVVDGDNLDLKDNRTIEDSKKFLMTISFIHKICFSYFFSPSVWQRLFALLLFSFNSFTFFSVLAPKNFYTFLLVFGIVAEELIE